MIYSGNASLYVEVHNNISGTDLWISVPMVVRTLSFLQLVSYLLFPIQAEIKPSSSEKSKRAMILMTMTDDELLFKKPRLNPNDADFAFDFVFVVDDEGRISLRDENMMM